MHCYTEITSGVQRMNGQSKGAQDEASAQQANGKPSRANSYHDHHHHQHLTALSARNGQKRLTLNLWISHLPPSVWVSDLRHARRRRCIKFSWPRICFGIYDWLQVPRTAGLVPLSPGLIKSKVLESFPKVTLVSLSLPLSDLLTATTTPPKSGLSP